MGRGSSRRLSLSIDLVASDGEYHKQCKTNFFVCKYIPGQKNVVKRLDDQQVNP